MSTAITWPRFDTKYAVSPMTSGDEAMPWYGQSAAVSAAEAARIPQVMIRRFIFVILRFVSCDFRLLVRVHTHVVEVDLGDAVAVEPGAAVLVRDAVDLLDRPRLRLGLADRPHLPAHLRGPVLPVVDPQLHAVPGVRLPLERNLHRHLVCRLPLEQLELLTVAEQDE